VIAFPQRKERATVGDIWKGMQKSMVTVAINMEPPPEEQSSEDECDDDILGTLQADSDDDF